MNRDNGFKGKGVMGSRGGRGGNGFKKGGYVFMLQALSYLII